MRITIFSLFPEYFESALKTALLGKALADQLLDVRLVDFREFTEDRHRTVDDTPYGGGPGMLLKPEPIVAAFEAHPPLPGGRRIYLTPWGSPLNQELVATFAELPELQLLCGRYEGVDERVIDGWIDQSVSIGDFVLAGGESAAVVVVEAVSRLVPGVLGDPESLAHESFNDGLLEGPQYTRPEVFRDQAVPDILRSGDHGKIAAWRRTQAVARTKQYRPELLDSGSDSGQQQ